MKIKVFSPICNRPEFIRIQHTTFKRFLKDDYELIVLNDAKDPKVREAINVECQRLSLACLETPDDLIHSSASVAHCAVIQWAYDNISLKEYADCINVFVDSDLFMINAFSIEEFVGDHAVGGLPQRRGNIIYYWLGMLILNVPQMPRPERLNVFCGIVRGMNVDSGGMTWYYFHENPQARVRRMGHTSHIHSSNENLHVLPESLRDDYDEEFRIEILESSFLHYGSASAPGGVYGSGSGDDYTTRKFNFVNQMIQKILDGDLTIDKIQFVFREKK